MYNYISSNLFEEIKFNAETVKQTGLEGQKALINIGNGFGFDAEKLITRGIANAREMISTSDKKVFDIIVELKHVVNEGGRYYHSRSEFTQMAHKDKMHIKDVINKTTQPIDSDSVAEWFIRNLNRIVACEVLLDYTDIDQQALNLEVSLKQFNNILATVSRSSNGDFSYRTNFIANYGTEAGVKIGLSEKEKAELKNPNDSNNRYLSNDREIEYTIKPDWYEKVFKKQLSYIDLNNGKIAAVLDAEPASHKTQDEDTNLWKLKVAYVKVPRDVALWRNNSKEALAKCVHFEELFYAEDKNDSERCATGTTEGRAIGTLNRRAKKKMFDLMGLDAL